MLLKVLNANNSHVHKADRLVVAAGIHFSTHVSIVLQRFLEQRSIRTFFNLNVLKFSQESSMAAVIRPVSIKNADFCFSRITLFTNKIFLKEFNVSQVHRKPHLLTVCFKFSIIPANKTSNNRNITRNRTLNFKSIRLRIVSQTAVYRVNKIILNFCNIISTKITAQNNNLSTSNTRSFLQNRSRRSHTRTQQRKTLFRTVRTLIILTRKIFPNNYSVALRNLNLLKINKITLRFTENSSSRSFTHSLAHIFNIIAVQVTHTSQTGNAQKVFNLTKIAFSLIFKTRLSFYI